MTKKTSLVWRLSKLPTPDEVRELVKDKIITQEEARELLFNFETTEDRDKNSLQAEIKFLRELVDKLSNQNPQIIVKYIETIKDNYPSFPNTPWYEPYKWYCQNVSNAGINSVSTLQDEIANFTNYK